MDLFVELSLFFLSSVLSIIDVIQSLRDTKILLIDILDVLLDILDLFLKLDDELLIGRLVTLELIFHLIEIFSNLLLCE